MLAPGATSQLIYKHLHVRLKTGVPIFCIDCVTYIYFNSVCMCVYGYLSATYSLSIDSLLWFSAAVKASMDIGRVPAIKPRIREEYWYDRLDTLWKLLKGIMYSD